MSTTLAGRVKIEEVDGLEIISLVYNSVDFLSTIDRKEVQSFKQWTKKRYGEEWARTHPELPVAEHGFSMLILVLRGRKSVSILFDTGISVDGVVENAKRMGLDLREAAKEKRKESIKLARYLVPNNCQFCLKDASLCCKYMTSIFHDLNNYLIWWRPFCPYIMC